MTTRTSEPPHRSALFVPARERRMLAKATTSSADCLWLDLEDSVSAQEKAAARELVREALPSYGDKAVYVRVNALSTGETLADLRAVVRPGLDGVVLAKTDSAKDIHIVEYLLQLAERENGQPDGATTVLATIESVAGIANCREIFRASPRVTGVLLGTAQDGDTQRDVGYQWTPEGTETAYIRGHILVQARAAGLCHLFEGPYVRHQDDDGLIRDARLGRQFGYTGKAAIHPRQVDIINDVFSPTEAELSYYRELAAAMEAAYANGRAAVTFDGRMVDTAMLAYAQGVLARAR